MAHQHHHHDHRGNGHVAPSLNRTAFQATTHCLTGCAIGEVLGMVVGTALGWSNLATIVIAVLLAFVFGYALTLIPLLRANMAFGTALGLAFAAPIFPAPRPFNPAGHDRILREIESAGDSPATN